MAIRFEEDKSEVTPSIALRIGSLDKIWGWRWMIDRHEIRQVFIKAEYADWVAWRATEYLRTCPGWREEVDRAWVRLQMWRTHLQRKMVPIRPINEGQAILALRGLRVPCIIARDKEDLERHLLDRVVSRVKHSIMNWKEDRI